MDLTFDHSDQLAAFFAPRVGVEAGDLPADMELMGALDSKGQIRAVFGYNAHYGHYLTMHIATDGSKAWATRHVLACMFGYPFHAKGVTRINALVPAQNVSVQILCLKLGFRIEATIRCGADDGSDGILFGMLAHECRWLKETRHGEEKPAKA